MGRPVAYLTVSNRTFRLERDIYYYGMEKLTDELAYQIIDWLTFREEVDHIPVVTGGEPRFK